MPLTSTLEKTPPPLPGITVDNTLPSPGGNLAVVTDSETSSGFSLSWDKGSDNQTAEENLKYLVYISDQDNITGVSNAENNGTLLNPNEQDQLDRNTYQVTGQNAETQYWATVILKDQNGNKDAYGVVTTTTAVAGSDGLDSRAGDEAALEKLYTETNGAGWTTSTGWASSGMDLSNSIHGVTTATIGGELRVTEIDLRNNNLTGQIDFAEWQNLKQCQLIGLYQNNIDTNWPSAIHNIGSSLEYLYLCCAEDLWDSLANWPHEAARQGRGAVDPAKRKTDEQNVIHGAIPSDIDNLSGLKWIVCNWSDEWNTVSNNVPPSTINGISSIPDSLWNITTLEGVMFYENWNIAESGNTFSWPETITHIPNLELVAFGGGTGSSWNGADQGYMTGGYPSDIGDLPDMRVLWMDGHPALTGFPDFSGSPNIVLINLKESSFSGQFPEYLVDGTLQDGRDDVAWQHHDSLVLAFPNGYSVNGSEFDITKAGLSGSIPDPVGGVQLDHLDNWDLAGNAIEGAVPPSFWDNNIRKITFMWTDIDSLGTNDMTAMTQTSVWFMKYAKIGPEKLPYLDWNNHDGVNYAWWQGNYYTFENLLYEPPNAPGSTCLDMWASITSNLVYAPQRPFGQSRNATYSVGENVTINDFDAVVTHAGNQYQWQLDGANITGATSRSLTISNIQSGDAGTYKLIVTNSGAPALTLESAPITITVE